MALRHALDEMIESADAARSDDGNGDRVRDGHAAAVLAASIFHFGEYSIREAKDYMAGAGLAMRLDA